ncbi:MAG: hypothetical protein COT88_02285 [Candidatus Colwellbacteria bacterium CG10_big_fil_rev_8_21_14_0_10_41_28]|uniref:Alpha-D-phosphohexomutase alpha/beta/alpha domain-containing protein n=1 Tax=Candidatus Colwellbacteria bacterium CG10_big_fil_rev_8_21_14_0_10_41_28 TaxID=1974539 RepID=A0A2H0VIZ3_9BACT|nr:MAG: hypothetical protein COT88_02285 [Candidatus Colwellbacteria bacterium CG10_big_fil_rev_8_21_14_0_10_41_28]
MTSDLKQKQSAFGKYDIRGVYPKVVDEELVYLISKALAEKKFNKERVIVGMDARESSPALYKEVIRGLHEGGVEVLEGGSMTTPMLYFLVNDLNLGGGIIVTASHNPKEYNGLKMVGRNADNISGAEVLDLIR